MVKVAPYPSARRYDEEPDLDEVPHPWLDDPYSPAYDGLCGRCGQQHDSVDCPNVTAVVWAYRRDPQ